MKKKRKERKEKERKKREKTSRKDVARFPKDFNTHTPHSWSSHVPFLVPSLEWYLAQLFVPVSSGSVLHSVSGSILSR